MSLTFWKNLYFIFKDVKWEIGQKLKRVNLTKYTFGYLGTTLGCIAVLDIFMNFNVLMMNMVNSLLSGMIIALGIFTIFMPEVVWGKQE